MEPIPIEKVIGILKRYNRIKDNKQPPVSSMAK